MPCINSSLYNLYISEIAKSLLYKNILVYNTFKLETLVHVIIVNNKKIRSTVETFIMKSYLY